MVLPALLAAIPGALAALGKTAAISAATTAASRMASNALTPRNGIAQSNGGLDPLMFTFPAMYLLKQIMNPGTVAEDYGGRGGYGHSFGHRGGRMWQPQFGQAQQAPQVPVQQTPQAPQMQPQFEPMDFQTQQLMARRRFQGNPQGGYGGGMNGF